MLPSPARWAFKPSCRGFLFFLSTQHFDIKAIVHLSPLLLVESMILYIFSQSFCQTLAAASSLRMHLSLPLPCSLGSLPFSDSFCTFALQRREPAISFHISFPIFSYVHWPLQASLLGCPGSLDLQGCQNIRNHLKALGHPALLRDRRRGAARWSVIKCFISPYCLRLQRSRGL